MSKEFHTAIRNRLHDLGHPVTHPQTKELIEGFWEEVKAEAERSGRFRINDFGAFFWKQAPARMAHNPRTGERVKVPARNKFKFKSYIDE